MNLIENPEEQIISPAVEDWQGQESGFVFEINTLACFYTVWAFCFAFYGLKVNDFNRLKFEPPAYGFLQVVGDQFTSLGYNLLFFCLVSSALFTGLLFGLRAVLPVHFKKYLCWRLPAGFQFPKKVNRAWPAVLSACISFASTTVLFFAFTHLRAERSRGQAVVWYEGPAADYINWVFVAGWTLSYLAVYFAAFTDSYFASRWNWLGKFASGVIGVNLTASLIIMVVVYED